MGVLRFHLCTKAPIDEGEEEDQWGNSKVNMDGQLNDVHEKDEQLPTETDAFIDTQVCEVVIARPLC